MWYCELDAPFNGCKYYCSSTFFHLGIFLKKYKLVDVRHWEESIWGDSIMIRTYSHKWSGLRPLTEAELFEFVFIKLSSQEIRGLI